MNPETSTDLPSQATTAAADNRRLPCRGCLPDCKNYDSCNGTPWRDTPDAIDD